MSLILEALRKSEAERRRGLAPDVAMELPPTPIAQPRTLAAWLLPAVLIAAVLIVAGWWVQRASETARSPATGIDAADSVLPQSAPGPVLAPRMMPMPAAPDVNSAPAVERASPPAAVPNQAAAAPPPLPASASTTPPLPVPPPLPSQPAPPRPPLTPPATGVSNDTSMLPPIKLSMHMWDEVPSKRFVIINGQRMAEGDRYGSVAVVAIERAGVVVESNGTTARVPLP
ncbi:MAG: general secretion pathway protein GspB [Pseudomonadota bacterium]|nr:general secretion pathway protein GspB [Pseudomonadota bacterium]